MTANSEESAAARAPAPLATKPRVLVIDDELGPRESMRFLLKGEYDVFVAETVAIGLDHVRDKKPDVIVMDIRMPGMNGIEGLREIRKIDQTVAIIMLTGFGALETAQEAIRFGANDYMKKPFDAAEMREAVRRNLQKVEITRKRALAERDLAELNRQLAAELQRKERMATLGLASAELVHDLRNPLTVIMGYVQLLGEELAEKSAASGDHGEYLDVIRKSVARCKDLVESWLSISRSEARAYSPVNLYTIASQISQEMMPMAADKKVQLRFTHDTDEALVLGEKTQLIRILQNLIINALDSLPDHDGHIELSLSSRNKEVVIEVRDNGCGIPPEQLENIFDPFHHTSKRESGGTGLGLFITRRIVDDHKGAIKLTSQPGQGTTVAVTFPAHIAAQEATA